VPIEAYHHSYIYLTLPACILAGHRVYNSGLHTIAQCGKAPITSHPLSSIDNYYKDVKAFPYRPISTFKEKQLLFFRLLPTSQYQVLPRRGRQLDSNNACGIVVAGLTPDTSDIVTEGITALDSPCAYLICSVLA